jgi:excisionase family DNA binding protein
MDGTGDIITCSIREFCRLSGISRSRVYELLSDRKLESICLGSRRLILLESYRRLIERQRATPQNQ